MRRFLSKTFIFIGILSLVLGTFNSFGHNISYAVDLELRGTDLGLEIIPSSTKLFDLDRLNPGDTKEGKITIKNNYTSPFNLYMRAERMSPVSENSADLFKQLNLTVSLKGTVVYSGSMEDFAISNILLGVFNPNDMEELKAIVHLPGPETGNEYQGTNVDVKWIFTATSEGSPPGPGPDPEPDPTPTPTPLPEPVVEESEVIIEEEIPEGIPEIIIEEEIPEGVPEQIIEEIPEEIEEVIQEEIPQAAPKMPKTGEISSIIFYGSGMLLLLMGVGVGFKKKE